MCGGVAVKAFRFASALIGAFILTAFVMLGETEVAQAVYVAFARVGALMLSLWVGAAFGSFVGGFCAGFAGVSDD